MAKDPVCGMFVDERTATNPRNSRGHDWNEVFIHDPLWQKTRRTGIAIQSFEEMVGYGSGQVMIIVWSRPSKR